METTTLSEQDDKYVKGWSWGAFFGSWIFLFVNKQKKWGWKILALFIFIQLCNYVPVVSVAANGFGRTLGIIYLGVCIWLGVRGREMVWKSGVYSSVEQFRAKQSLVTKLNVVFIIVTIGLSIYSFVSLVGPAINHPELIDQQIMQQALLKEKSTTPNVNDADFEQGYNKGLADGKAKVARSFTADQTTSYQDGYSYGYGVACMKIYNNQALCINKMLGR